MGVGYIQSLSCIIPTMLQILHAPFSMLQMCSIHLSEMWSFKSGIISYSLLSEPFVSLEEKNVPKSRKEKGNIFHWLPILSHLILAATLMEMIIISISQVVKLRVHKDEVFFSISWEFRVEPMSHSNAHFLPSVLSWLSVAFQISSLPPLCTCKLIYPYFMQSNSHFDKMI